MRSLIRSRRVALPLAALALAGTGVAAYGATSDDGADYRTVAAATGSVEQELSLSGVISPSGRSDLAFGTDGTVARVGVAQGDEVEEGDVIAVLDRASLRAAVNRAKSDLASAKAQLADDRDAQTTSVTTAASTSSGSGSSGTSGRSTGGTPRAGGSGSTSGATAALVKKLTDQQDAVIAAQSAAGTALASAGTALSDQQAACADPVTSTTETATDAPTDGTEPTAGTTTTTAVLSEACTTALTAVQAAQVSASDAQTALQSALEALGDTLTEALGSVQSGGSSSAGNSAPSSASTPSASSTASSSSSSSSAPSAGGTSRTVTAATLAQDQASIDRARADLVAAQAGLAGAVVRAPADGTVVSLAVTKDADVSAGDTVATVVAPGLTTVSVDVSATEAAELEQGMDVEVTPAGATDALAGSISRVEHVASSGSTTGSDPTYAVAIVLDERDLQLADGMPASVTVVVGSADDVVVVPASAVDNGSVTVLENGTAQRVRVSTGIVGATQIEVTDGLEDGDVVVLADLDAELPTGDSDQQTGFGGGGFGGGFSGGGGGFPAGGPPSGGGFGGR